MKALLVAFVILLQPLPAGSPVASASTVPELGSPCAALSLAFIPNTVMPGQAMDYFFDLSNCGTFTERLIVRLDPTGPCRFLPRSRKTYVLEPGQGLSIWALMLAPSCSGDYRLRGTVQFDGRTLDRARASFRVGEGTGGIRSPEPRFPPDRTRVS